MALAKLRQIMSLIMTKTQQSFGQCIPQQNHHRLEFVRRLKLKIGYLEIQLEVPTIVHRPEPLIMGAHFRHHWLLDLRPNYQPFRN